MDGRDSLLNTGGYVDQFAKVISDVLDADVMIVDKKKKIIGKAFKHLDLYNDIHSGSLITKVIENNENVLISNKSLVEGCKKCPDYKKCQMKGFIGVPVRYDNEVIGATALLLTRQKSKKLFDTKESSVKFVENMAELVAIRIHEHIIKKSLKKKVNEAQLIMDALQEAFVFTDKYGNVRYANDAFRKMFEDEIGEIKNIKSVYPDVIRLYKRKKRIENYKISVQLNTKPFIGTISCTSITMDDEEGFLCSFKSYEDIHTDSMLFKTGSMVTFSWLTKYVTREFIEEAKDIAEMDNHVLICSTDNALNELVGKAIVNYSRRRLQKFQIINMQNVYRDLLERYLFGEFGVLKGMDKGVIMIICPENIPYFIQVKLVDFINMQESAITHEKKEDVDIRFIFCTTENLADLMYQGMFYKGLYEKFKGSILQNKDTLFSDKKLFYRFVYSGIKYYNRIYNKSNEELVDKLQKYLWKNKEAMGLCKMELFIEKIVSSGENNFNNFLAEQKTYIHTDEISMDELEEEKLKKLLENGRDKRTICSIMGYSRSTLYRRIKRSKLEHLL